MADEDVGAFVDRLVREAGDESGGFFELRPAARGQQACAAKLVAVNAHDQPVRLAPCLANPTQVVLQVALVGLGFDRETLAAHIAIAQQAQFGGFCVGNLLIAVEMLARPFMAFSKPSSRLMRSS